MPKITDDAPAAAPGFTLLEVIVALAITALAMIELFQAGSGGMFAANTAAGINEAVERARSHLAAISRAGAIVPGTTSGDDGGGYRWSVRATPLAIGPTTAEQPRLRALYDVAVIISWHDGRRSRSVVIESRRIGAASAQ